MSAFDYFVIFAGMRTGSNYLERNLNSAPDVQSYGELFNPYFIAHEGQDAFLGMTLADRESEPVELIERVRAETEGLAGFRLFHDHDRRVRDVALADPRCAKIILTRNPVESYVSYVNAMASNQWVLTDAKGQIDVPPVVFKPEEFQAFARAQATFLNEVRVGLAAAGQTALQIDYTDLGDLTAVNGVLSYLGSRHRLNRPERSLKRQNPADVLDRVANPGEMQNAISTLDPFGLDPTVAARLERGAAVRSYVAAAQAPLLYLPVHGPLTRAVTDWMTALDHGEAPQSGMTQKDLRDWRLSHPGARSFTVVTHPVRRAWDAFETAILPRDLRPYAEVRRGLVTAYKIPLPERWPDPDLPTGQLRRAFLGFCKFLKANLAGQTSLRIDDAWLGQHTKLHGMAAIALPDLILRDCDMHAGLMQVARMAGCDTACTDLAEAPKPELLSRIYNQKVETSVRTAYARDYAVFGFSDWSAS
ncbi:nodulation protein NodH [Tropicimonas sp. S265A]|uniref:nodulation protein NodH n=1 Tax=Tropicimonas sp. S265A TaxID=3415134 RepID=UPI003C79F12A